MTVNGTITRLQAGHYAASVASVGASLVSLTYRGRHLVQPFAEDTLAEGYQGCTLVPWPNRVVQGQYAVRGAVHELPVNERDTGSALHGLGCFQQWVPTDVAQDHGSWLLDLPPSYGYPFDIVCRVDYRLDADTGLAITITGTNRGPDPAPFGASTHPYLSCDTRPLAECTLRIPATAYLLTDEHLAPTTVAPVDGTDADFREPALVGERMVDNAYTDLPAGGWSIELTHPETGGVQMSSDARWVQLYTGDRIGRLGAALEPMTCPPDAFNRDPEGVLLDPGDSRVLRVQVSALPPCSP